MRSMAKKRHSSLRYSSTSETVFRAVAMSSTDGLVRGMDVAATGSAISVPVGEAVLGRIFNVTGDTVDEKGPVATDERRPIHRMPPELVDQATEAEILETGIKVIDLICPSLRAARSVPSVVPVWVRLLLSWN